MGYAFFGYLMAGRFEMLPIAANTLALLGAHFFWFSLNDYSDLKTEGEENYMKTQVTSGKITRRKALILCFLPLVLAPLVILTGSIPAILIFVFSLILNSLYSLGPLRLKSHKYLWATEAFLPAPLTFIQASSVAGIIRPPIILMAVILALFYFYTGILHILEDFQAGEKVQKIPQSAALKLLKIVPATSLVTSLVFALFYPFFLVTTIFSLIRLLSLKGFKPNQVYKTRRNLFSFRFSLYEFAIYALFAITGQI